MGLRTLTGDRLPRVRASLTLGSADSRLDEVATMHFPVASHAPGPSSVVGVCNFTAWWPGALHASRVAGGC